MARRKRTTGKVTKAVRTLTYSLPSGASYVDIMKDLSIVNRKMMRQGYCVGIESVEFLYSSAPGAVDTLVLTAYTAGDSWPVHNAHVKSRALWDQMNQLVLEDNPSVQGKWADFKVYLDEQHHLAGNLDCLDAAGVPYLGGEWNYSTFVLPEHDVDPVTGIPVAADETEGHLIGPDLLDGSGKYVSVGLVNAYEQSRATVSNAQPNVPAAFSASFFNKLTDSGSQEPELADLIEGENDNPPYNTDNYPGGAVNAPHAILTEFAAASVGQPIGLLSPFVAQCGLIRFKTSATLNGESVTAPTVTIRVNIMAGKYKGIAAIPMGQ